MRQLHYAQPAQEATRLDYLHEVDHMAERLLRLEQAISDTIKTASTAMQELISGLQALRDIADFSRNRRGRVGQHHTLREYAPVDGLQRRRPPPKNIAAPIRNPKSYHRPLFGKL